MPMWPVRNIMTIDVITAPDDALIAEVAAILAERGISAVPIVNQFDVVVGVVSWTDLHPMIRPGEDSTRGGWLRRDRAAQVGWPDLEAVQVMSAPPVTVGPDASLAAAGRLMHRHNIGRLLVTDPANRLLGIVTRRDLLKVHARLDAVIRDEVTHRILRRILMIEPGSVQVAVHDGVVTLIGRMRHKSTALAAAGMTAAVAGVTEVVNQLAFDTDDTRPAPTPQPPAQDPMHGWWEGRRDDSPADVPSAATDTGQGGRTGADNIKDGAMLGQASATAPDGHPERPNSGLGVPPAGADSQRRTGDIVDEWGRQSFPASDPPTNW
jgi:CBS domain-containing protein